MITDIKTNKGFQTVIKELFIRGRKLNISLVFIIQSYFPVPKDFRLNTTHYFIMKTNDRRELKRTLPLIIRQTLITKILRTFTENVQKNLLIF